MSTVTCPSCGEKGPIPRHLIGKRIKCTKCGSSFLVTAPASKVAVAVTVTTGHVPTDPPSSRDDVIEVAGLDDSAWAAAEAGESALLAAIPEHAPAPVEPQAQAPEPRAQVDGPAFTATHHDVAFRQYKILTQKDRWFAGKFDLVRLEEALNHYAREGWVVRSMVTPHIAGFSGGPREELVVLLER